MQLSVHFQLTLTNGTGQQKRQFPLTVDFDITDFRTVIFGPSGCGKSVTLQAIAGLIKPQKGLIKLDERVLLDTARKKNVPADRRRIGYVFQDYALFPHLSVLKNAGYALRRWPLPLSKDEKNTIMEMLGLLGIADLANSFPKNLSGGQRQRVALARVLLSKPDILLLDEPFSAMDMMLRIKMREELIQIQERFKVPLVMITHDLEDVKAFAQTLVLYKFGTVTDVLSCDKMRAEFGEDQAWGKIVQSCKNVFELN